MIRQETISKFPSANALYSGFGAFLPYSYLSGTTVPVVPTGGGGGNTMMVGPVAALGGGAIEAGMQQPWLRFDSGLGGF
jgi:hypothetical protein